ncbi:MAG: RHS repeat-associated core domain-containing protein, partial [Bdellovibrionales bacterium]
TFTSREYDVETAFLYYRARYYSTDTGRWVTQDPLGFDAGDSNLYRYVMNKPTMARDPSGMIPIEIRGTNNNLLPQLPLFPINKDQSNNILEDIKQIEKTNFMPFFLSNSIDDYIETQFPNGTLPQYVTNAIDNIPGYYGKYQND